MGHPKGDKSAICPTFPLNKGVKSMEFGTKVKAYPLDESGPKVGFFIDNNGDKDTIQVGDTLENLAYREPHDYDEHGANGTYCRVP